MAQDGGQTVPNLKPSLSPGAVAIKRQNPALRMLGLPQFRLRLPSRNWMIFLSITGSFTAAIVYDRREKRRAQEKWCALVRHLAEEKIPPDTLPRKVTIFVSAPPGDGLRASREHFHEYVKPVLVAAALDWDVVEGRREGEVRAGLAERVRKRRRLAERSGSDDASVEKDPVEEVRDRAGVKRWSGIEGDIVIGRHTWKEYVEGLHEGWLGPLQSQNASHTEQKESAEEHVDQLKPETVLDSNEANTSSQDQPGSTVPPDEISPNESEESTESNPNPPQKNEEKTKNDQKPPRPPVPAPFIMTSAYPDAHLPPSIPEEFSPSTPIPLPHILGFLNTPKRVYRFLNRRYLADDIGREVASAVLTASRPFQSSSAVESTTHPGEGVSLYDSSPSATGLQPHLSSTDRDDTPPRKWEQEEVLVEEEPDWPKSIRQRERDGTRSVWLDPMVLDRRIAERMRRFYLDPEVEEAARRDASVREVAKSDSSE